MEQAPQRHPSCSTPGAHLGEPTPPAPAVRPTMNRGSQVTPVPCDAHTPIRRERTRQEPLRRRPGHRGLAEHFGRLPPSVRLTEGYCRARQRHDEIRMFIADAVRQVSALIVTSHHIQQVTCLDLGPLPERSGVPERHRHLWDGPRGRAFWGCLPRSEAAGGGRSPENDGRHPATAVLPAHRRPAPIPQVHSRTPLESRTAVRAATLERWGPHLAPRATITKRRRVATRLKFGTFSPGGGPTGVALIGV